VPHIKSYICDFLFWKHNFAWHGWMDAWSPRQLCHFSAWNFQMCFYFGDHIQFLAVSSFFLLFAITNSVLKVAERCTEITRAEINVCICCAI
jgi:hypothetical protein